MVEERILMVEFNGYDERIEGILCRIYKVPRGLGCGGGIELPSAEVTFIHSREETQIHLSISLFREVGNDGIDERDIVAEELITVEGISAITVRATIIHIQSSILFDYTELKYKILLALGRAFKKMSKE